MDKCKKMWLTKHILYKNWMKNINIKIRLIFIKNKLI